ncbi:unnamed protein product [Musa textilis]
MPADKAHMASPPGGSSSVIVPLLPAWSWRGIAVVGYQDPCLGDDDGGDRLELQVRRWPCFCRAGLQYARSIQQRVHGYRLLIR